MLNFRFDDFTEDQYRINLQLAKTKWKVVCFSHLNDSGRVCLWRHDVDCSMHRACKLANIENEEGIVATYFLWLHSRYYNLLEREVANLVSAIIEKGHEIGLHFDPGFYSSMNPQSRELERFLEFEKQIIEKNFGVSVQAFSLHNPEVGGWLNLAQDEINGMINTYGPTIKKNFIYVSDSNGYWRYQRLSDVLKNPGNEKLHILTHPEWWTPEILPPRDRISRCIEGRSAKQHAIYDEALKKMGRLNVGFTK